MESSASKFAKPVEQEPLPERDLFVYIIESPSDVDLYHKTWEGEALAQILNLAGIPYRHRFVVTEEALKGALEVGFREIINLIKEKPQCVPIIHISAHGDASGIGLANGQIVTWKSLRELLLPLNKELQGNKLVLCMSSCHGFGALKMAMQDDDFPFTTLIGNSGKPTWSETTIAYSTFYHLLKRGVRFRKAVENMGVASGNQEFLLISAKTTREVYKAELAKATSKDPTDKGDAISV